MPLNRSDELTHFNFPTAVPVTRSLGESSMSVGASSTESLVEATQQVLSFAPMANKSKHYFIQNLMRFL